MKRHEPRQEWKSERDWIPVPVPAILDEATFTAAKARLEKNKQIRSGRPPRYFWLLKGFLKCGLCKRRLGSYPTHGNRFYRCVGYDRAMTHSCDGPMVRAEHIENSVVEDLKRLLGDPKLLEAKLSNVMTDGRDLNRELELTNSSIKSVRLKEGRLLDLRLEDKISKPAMEQKARDLKAEMARLDEQHRAITDAIQLRAEKADVMIAARNYARKIRMCLDDANFEPKRKLFEALIDEIIIDGHSYSIKGAISFERTSAGSPPVSSPCAVEQRKLSTTC